MGTGVEQRVVTSASCRVDDGLTAARSPLLIARLASANA